MAVPTTREEFKQYCLRKLGAPVIEINVDDNQVEDRIDEALKYFWDYHFDGSEMSYYSHQITAGDKAAKGFTMPEGTLGVVRVFPVSSPSIGSADMFNIRYQIALNDLYNLTSVSLVPYHQMREHLTLIEEILVGKQPVRFTRVKNFLHVDMDWEKVNEGSYIMVEAYAKIDPDDYPDLWGDRWLQIYATSLIKKQWGSNIKKFSNMVLPGGAVMNGQQIYDEADREIQVLEEQMINDFSMPVLPMTG